eukprot:12961343-Ditylum_brightwellii.AAC.1
MDRGRVIKRIKEAENSKRMFSTIRRYLHQGDRLGLTHVDISDWGRVELLCAIGFTTLLPGNQSLANESYTEAQSSRRK